MPPDFRVSDSHPENAIPSASPPSARQNHILAGLGDSDLELVSLRAGDVLHNAGDTLDEIYFPTTCIVSLIAGTRSGAPTKLAMIANEGLASVSLVLGNASANHRLVVQGSGEAYRLKAETLHWALREIARMPRIDDRQATPAVTANQAATLGGRNSLVCDSKFLTWVSASSALSS